MMCAPPFRPTIPRKRCRAPSLPLRRWSTGVPQSRIFGPKLILHIHGLTIQVRDTYIRREQAPNMVNYRVHMAPFSMLRLMLHNHTMPSTPPPPHSLHITGPAQRTRVDKPHPTSVAGTRPAVARCALKEVAQTARNGSCVSNRYNCTFPQDTLNGDDVKDRFPVIELDTT